MSPPAERAFKQLRYVRAGQGHRVKLLCATADLIKPKIARWPYPRGGPSRLLHHSARRQRCFPSLPLIPPPHRQPAARRTSATTCEPNDPPLLANPQPPRCHACVLPCQKIPSPASTDQTKKVAVKTTHPRTISPPTTHHQKKNREKRANPLLPVALGGDQEA